MDNYSTANKQFKIFLLFFPEYNDAWPLFFYLFYHNFFDILLSYVFCLQEDFYGVSHNVDTFFSFFLISLF